MEKAGRDLGNFLDCGQERSFICLRRFVKTADFPDELERSRSNLFRSYGRIEIKEGLNISAHTFDLNAPELAADGGRRSLSCFLMRGGAQAIRRGCSYFAYVIR